MVERGSSLAEREPPFILVILPNNLGDVIMAAPVLEGLKHRYPGCRAAFLVEDGFQDGLERNPFCDEILRFPRKLIRDALSRPDWQTGTAALQDFVNDLNARGFHQVINLSQHKHIAYLVGLLRVPEIAGQRFMRQGNFAVPDAWSQYLYAIPFSRRCNLLHASDVYRRIAGVTRHGGGYRVYLDESEKHAAAEYLQARGVRLTEGKLMVFQAGAAYPSKRWPAESYVQLGRMLRSDGWQILVSGAPAESDAATAIADELGGGCVSCAGDTTFRQAVALLSHAQACVTPDTALMHASAALGVKTYALFGSTNPVETGPYGDGHWVFSAYCPARPCFDTSCRTMLCMRSIPAATIYGCIKNSRPSGYPRCDIYRTELRPDQDYTVFGIASDSYSYVNSVGAALTLRAFEPRELPNPYDRNLLDGCRRETLEFAGILDDMEARLDAFVKDRDVGHVRAFEQAKARFTAYRSIGAFWAALLNIGLNSVPLLDASEGVRQSRAVCAALQQRIQQSLAGIP